MSPELYVPAVADVAMNGLFFALRPNGLKWKGPS